MKVHTEFGQGSQAWMDARIGLPTASEFDNLLTPKFKLRTGQTPLNYLNKKVAEYWLGNPLLGFSSFATDQGNVLEDEAKPWYSMQYNVDIKNVGFITTDDGRIGCSPDGLLGDSEGLEIKCPEPHTHVGYLMDNVVPEEYLLQVHGSMYVTGFKSWKFLSYRRHFPALVLTVQRDEAIIEAIHEAVTSFLNRFDQAIKTLEMINGGPSDQRRRAMEARELAIKNPVRFSWEQQDQEVTP